MSQLFRDSLAFRDTDEKWKDMRKVVSAAFYKEKIRKMMHIMKAQTVRQIKEWNKAIEMDGSGSAEIILKDGVQEINVRTIVTVAFGEDLSDHLINFKEKGQDKQIRVGFAFEKITNDMLQRPANGLRGLTDRFDKLNFTQFERETYFNSLSLREFVDKIARKLASEYKGKEEKLLERGDLISYLLYEFKDDYTLVIDQIVEFFVAATQTTVSTALNVMHHLMQNPESLSKLKQDFKKNFDVNYEEGTIKIEDLL